MSTKSMIDRINNYLLESENFADEFLPLKATLEPIKDDFQLALNELKRQADEADDLADKVFYLNRYTDLVKKVEGVFDTRSKRLQQTLSMLTKLPQIDNVITEQSDVNVEDDIEKDNTPPLTPEEASVIIGILNKQ